jgi:DNA-cytosine methyltransferase
MSIGKDTFCRGVDIYNLSDTGDICASVTTCVGQSTATGPKVAVSKNRPFPVRMDSAGNGVCGTIDAHIYCKNNRQDNSKYIIEKKGKGRMTMEDAIKEINKDAPHQQDQLNYDKDAARSLAAGTHGAASHLTKTVCEDDEQCVVRRLTTTETARLQGFPDDYTKINGNGTSDAPQYKAHGNSWATPCAFFMSSRMELEMRRLGVEGAIRYATCCSGIEAHSTAVKNLDWKSVFFSEIEPFPCDVLKHHYPNTPNLGDMTQIHYDANNGVITNSHKDGETYDLPSCFRRAEIQRIPYKVGDLHMFSGGTPCQSVSVAGKREGMAEGSGTRSSLAFHYQRIIDEMQPMMTLWENVPGAFSSNGGKDFIWFVNKCAESGYTMAWRVIDAQYTTTEEFPRAVPQRRRRIWLVGYRGKDWRVPARVVFELKKELTDEPPIRIPGKGFTTLNPDFDENDAEIRVTSRKKSKKDDGQGLFAFDVVETNDNKLKVSHLIDFEDMPSESNFALLSQTDIYNFISKVGEPCYIGPVFRSDRKKKKEKKQVEFDLFATAPQVEDTVDGVAGDEPSEWEGAEKICPGILANIGNSGILSNGMIATINCHEWTSGIQLSPTKYNIYNEFAKNYGWLKANDLLPKAYDGTVCGLSDVLEENPDEKYNLSWRACFGILKRAAGRGKELPPALEIALIATIREKAGIVKWIAVNGKDTKKKESDLSERESARLCFDEYISSVMNFDDVVAVEPKKRNGDDEGEDDEVADDFDDEGNPIENEEDFGVSGNPTISADGDVIEASGNDGDSDKSSQVAKGVDTKLDASRVEDEVSPTLLATSYKEPPAVIK